MQTPFPCAALPCLGAFMALAFALPAHAAGVVGTGTPASCTEAALTTAMAGGGAVTFNCGAAPHTIVLTTQKNLSMDTQIDGGGRITIDGNQLRRHFYMASPAHLALTGLTLARGYSAATAGSIYAEGPGAALTLTDVTLANNVADNRGGAIVAINGVAINFTRVRASGNRALEGGVIFTLNSNATITLNQFAAIGNHADLSGGAIHHKGGTMLISDSLFAGNSIDPANNQGGGAIDVQPAGASNFTITNSTFQGNSAINAGSAIRALNVAGGDIASSTFSGNTGAPAITAYGTAQLTLRNTIVANTSGHANCTVQNTATITDSGNNLQFGGSVAQSCGGAIPEADPLLAPLANNGGFTQSMALQAGSPAIDAGNACPPADQRGVARPVGMACDIGAFEGLAPVPPVVPGGASAIPTLGHAGLALLSALVAGAGALRRRRFFKQKQAPALM